MVSQNLALVFKQFFNKESKSSISIPIPWKDPPLQEATIGIHDINVIKEVKKLTFPNISSKILPNAKESRIFMDVKGRALRITEQKKVKEVPFKVYHQNITSLRRKYQELLCYLYPELPHIICLKEHHLSILEYSHINVEGYTVGAQFCRALHEKGEVIMYVYNNLKFTNIDLSEYCKEKILKPVQLS